jgi:AraC family transcriptional activator of pobA
MTRGRLPGERLSNSQPGQGVLNVPAYFLYGENWTQSIFGFFHIEPLAVRSVPNNWRIASHRHLDFDQLSILFSGRCTFGHDGQKGAAEAPSCVYTPANVVHQFSYSPRAIGFIVSVSHDFASGLPSVEGATNAAMFRLASNRVIMLHSEAQVATIKNLVDLLAEKASAVHRYRRDSLRYLFGAMLLELDSALGEIPGRKSGRDKVDGAGLFQRFRDLIQSTIGAVGLTDETRKLQISSVEAFAERLLATRYALNAVCQSVCGCPAREVIQIAILEQATRLLLYTTKPVKEISFLLGYSNASHFARFFKQRRGSTPEIFRATCEADSPFKSRSLIPRSTK